MLTRMYVRTTDMSSLAEEISRFLSKRTNIDPPYDVDVFCRVFEI